MKIGKNVLDVSVKTGPIFWNRWVNGVNGKVFCRWAIELWQVLFYEPYTNRLVCSTPKKKVSFASSMVLPSPRPFLCRWHLLTTRPRGQDTTGTVANMAKVSFQLVTFVHKSTVEASGFAVLDNRNHKVRDVRGVQRIHCTKWEVTPRTWFQVLRQQDASVCV